MGPEKSGRSGDVDDDLTRRGVVLGVVDRSEIEEVVSNGIDVAEKI